MELASCSFGQSSKVSYLQMITAVAAIVNGGRLMEPYVVAEARDSDGVLLWEKEPTVKRQVISEETSETMCLLMENVVATGTGQNASVAGYRVGGKSGTSQKLDSEDASARIASFVAVAPVEEPRLAVLVCLDEPHSWTTSGGSLSAPVCAEVLAKALPYLGIVDTVKAVIDQMDAELRGNPVFASVEEMGEVELEARRRADDLIDKQL